MKFIFYKSKGMVASMGTQQNPTNEHQLGKKYSHRFVKIKNKK